MQKAFDRIILLLLLVEGIFCQSTSKVLGVGVGTLIIIIAIIFSIIWCFACRSSSRPELYSLLGLLVPAVLIIAFIFTPKYSQKPAATTVTDSNFIPHIVFMVLSILGFVVVGAYLLIAEAFTYKKAKNVARSAFTMREEEQIPLQERAAQSNAPAELQIESNAHTENMGAP